MINFIVGPGNSPWQVAGANNNDRRKWGDTLQVPLNYGISFATGDFTDPNEAANPINTGHAQYLRDIDPRSDHGRANRLNPNNPNYSNYNPTWGRIDLL